MFLDLTAEVFERFPDEFVLLYELVSKLIIPLLVLVKFLNHDLEQAAHVLWFHVILVLISTDLVLQENLWQRQV